MMKNIKLAAATLMTAMLTSPAQAANVAHGKQLFIANCAYCHGVTGLGGPVGPSLKGILNRPAGSVPDFPYSEAMKASGLKWTQANLAEYLTNPAAKIKDTRMVFPGLPSRSDVSDVIAFLKQIK